MAVLDIPTLTDNAHYEFEIELDLELFRFRFLFNEREERWYFDLLDGEGNRIRSGVKAVTNTPLLRLISQQLRPDGELLALDPTGQDLEAGLTDLGGAVTFTYVEKETVDEAIGA